MTNLTEQIRDQLYIANLIALAQYQAADHTGVERAVLAKALTDALGRMKKDA